MARDLSNLPGGGGDPAPTDYNSPFKDALLLSPFVTYRTSLLIRM